VRGKGTKLGEGERDVRDYYANPDSGRLLSGLFHLGIVRGAVLNFCGRSYEGGGWYIGRVCQSLGV
jgi:hypothetical protein